MSDPEQVLIKELCKGDQFQFASDPTIYEITGAVPQSDKEYADQFRLELYNCKQVKPPSYWVGFVGSPNTQVLLVSNDPIIE